MGKKIPTHFTYRPKYGLGKKIASLTSKDVDKMYVILPFEKTFYEDKHNFRSSLWVTL
jgi:lipid-A-disaccharide synthase